MDCTAIILNMHLQGEDVMKIETVGISKVSEMRPTCTQCHLKTGSTLALNFHESLKYTKEPVYFHSVKPLLLIELLSIKLGPESVPLPHLPHKEKGFFFKKWKVLFPLKTLNCIM